MSNVQVVNNKMNAPLVSIGLPVYNGGKFICKALDSLLTQIFSDFELIISDNASTDNTEVICHEYAIRDERIRYIRQSRNLGAMANFQFVLDEAIGEYFMWAAADDYRDPNFLSLTVAVLKENLKVGLVFSNMQVVDLVNNISTLSVCKYTSAKKKYKKYWFRLFNACPSLIYGLHRTSELRKFQIEQYDYIDIHLTHWYELNSNIKIVPFNLYTAGTNGRRIPYSLTSKYIDSKKFLKKEWSLLRHHFHFPCACILFLATAILYIKNNNFQNRIIKEARRSHACQKYKRILR